jgi:GNAT superfamily N-acetyltransferase
MFVGVPVPKLLHAHLDLWLGAWPPQGDGISIIGSTQREIPGWDDVLHEVIGVATPDSAVLSVAPAVAEELSSLRFPGEVAADIALLNDTLPKIFRRPGRIGRGLFRWSDNPTDTHDVGDWVPTEDPRVPEWLKPFNDEVLIAWDDDARYGAGVGRKKHDKYGHELSVGTEESLRGRGIGRKLVATAARRVLDDGAIPTYLHAPDNFASAKVADAAGFPDVGWSILGFWS